MDSNPESRHNFEVTASHDIRGGGTGGEFAHNLLSTGTEPWNKWFASTSHAEIYFKYQHNVVVDGLGFRAANDAQYRDPTFISAFYWDNYHDKWINFY